MDVSKLIGKTEQLVLPWFGGARVVAAGRTLRLAPPLPGAAGFYRFEVKGRSARLLEPAELEPGRLESLPRVRGHFAAGWVASSGRDIAPLGIAPAEEPAELAIVRARRWHSGDLLLESVDFETEVEEAARAALFDGRSLEGVRGVAPSLRLAFGIATFLRAARAEQSTTEVPEILAAALLAADGGAAAARVELQRRAEERAAAIARHEMARRERLRTAETAVIEAARDERVRRTWTPDEQHGARAENRRRSRGPTFEDQVEAALEHAQSELMSMRRLEAQLVEVGWRHRGQTFFSIVRDPSMQVVDAGFCLDGADGETNLASLPGVAREAIDEGVLYINRR